MPDRSFSNSDHQRSKAPLPHNAPKGRPSRVRDRGATAGRCGAVEGFRGDWCSGHRWGRDDQVSAAPARTLSTDSGGTATLTWIDGGGFSDRRWPERAPVGLTACVTRRNEPCCERRAASRSTPCQRSRRRPGPPRANRARTRSRIPHSLSRPRRIPGPRGVLRR